MRIRKKREEGREMSGMQVCKGSVVRKGHGEECNGECKVKRASSRVQIVELKEGSSRRVVQVQGGKRRRKGK